MEISQVSVFLENKKGRLREVAELLAGKGINIRSLSLADTESFGVLRMIVSEPDRCIDVLKEKDIAARKTPVIAVEVNDRPGGLLEILRIFDSEDINVEYMYATFEKSKDKAVMIFRVEETGKAAGVLKKSGFSIADSSVFQ